MTNGLPPLPEPIVRVDQDDDNNTWGALQEKAWDSDYSLKLNDPLFTAEQMQEYARAAIAQAHKPLTDGQKQRIHNETGAGHALICLVEGYVFDSHGIKGGEQ